MDPLALLLADGRWPGGGYAHSGGVEPAVADGSIHDPATLESFVAGRLTSNGVTDAWIAAAAAGTVVAHDRAVGRATGELLQWQAEAEARMPSAPLRAAGRALGRGLRRTAAQCWPAQPLDHRVEQYAVVLGAVAAIAGLSSSAAAELSIHHALFGPLTAAPKLMAIDMADSCGIAVRLAPLARRCVDEAVAAVAEGRSLCWSSPLVELRAELHATWEVRHFAS